MIQNDQTVLGVLAEAASQLRDVATSARDNMRKSRVSRDLLFGIFAIEAILAVHRLLWLYDRWQFLDFAERSVSEQLGLSSLAAALVAVIALLLVRRAELNARDISDFSALREQSSCLKYLLSVSGQETMVVVLRAARACGVSDHALRDAIEKTDGETLTKVDVELAKSPLVYADILANSKLVSEHVEQLRRAALDLTIPLERLLGAYLFAVVSGWIILLPWFSYGIGVPYLSLASVALASIVASYGLLGRRLTNEAHFLSDVRGLGGTMRVGSITNANPR